jgi:hypothetical protein
VGTSSKDSNTRTRGTAQSTSTSSGAKDDASKGELVYGEFKQVVSETSKDWVIKLWHPDIELLTGGMWITVCNQDAEDAPYIPLRYRSKVDAELAMAVYFRDELVTQKNGGPTLIKACFAPAINWLVN